MFDKLYPFAIRAGVKPIEYWDMTYGEIMDSIEQDWYFRYIHTEEERYKLESVLSYIGMAIHQIPINVNTAIMGKTANYPKITDYMPERVKEQLAREQEIQKKRSADLRFLSWADRINKKFKVKESEALDSINSKISQIGSNNN